MKNPSQRMQRIFLKLMVFQRQGVGNREGGGRGFRVSHFKYLSLKFG